jgi:hypothetical protein
VSSRPPVPLFLSHLPANRSICDCQLKEALPHYQGTSLSLSVSNLVGFAYKLDQSLILLMQDAEETLWVGNEGVDR